MCTLGGCGVIITGGGPYHITLEDLQIGDVITIYCLILVGYAYTGSANGADAVVNSTVPTGVGVGIVAPNML